MKYKIDKTEIHGEQVYIRGWAAPSDKNNSTEFLVRTKDKETIPFRLTRNSRKDVGVYCFGDESIDQLGFNLTVEIGQEEKMFVTIREISKESQKPIDSITFRLVKKGLQIGVYNVMEEMAAIRREGVFRWYKLKQRERNYVTWFNLNKPTEKELQRQSEEQFAIEPKFSIIVPVYNTPLKFLDEMIQSVQMQSYSNWELCIANGSKDNEQLVEALRTYAEADYRIKWKNLEKNEGISGNTNAAMTLAEGEFIALLDHDDILAPNALYEYVKALNEDPEIDAMYSDEDKIDQSGEVHFEAHFKPDLNIELLRTGNYICHFFAVRKSIVDQFGGFNSKYDGAQDMDFIFRSVELSRKVYHCPKILYYWRCHLESTAANPESKMYAYEAGVRAVQDHLQRCGVEADVKIGFSYGYYHTTFHLPYHPKVTIVIPNKDHIDDLKTCVESIYGKSTYDNYEILIVENNSMDEKTFQYYEELQQKHENLKVINWGNQPFNYASINNFGVKEATGEYVLLLNNDTEVIAPNFLESMLGVCMQNNTAVVGARLYYGDDTIQHAGVIVGIKGSAGHILSYTDKEASFYQARQNCVQNLSAVTGACMLVKKSVYEELNGLDETFAVAFNDVDFCLRVCEAGYKVAYQPDAKLYHYESKSRGYEDSPEKKKRFKKEAGLFRERWMEYIENGDPYYNKNLSKKHTAYMLDIVGVKEHLKMK